MAVQTVQHSEGTTWRRVGSTALIAAGALILTSALFPVPDNPGDHAEFLRLLAENASTAQAVLITVPVGIWAFATGVVALGHTGRPATPWLRLGRYAVLTGAAVVTVQFALGNAALAEATEGSFEVGLPLWLGASYMRSFGMLVLWAGIAALGRGILTSGTYPRSVGWPALILGLAMVVVSAVGIVNGLTEATARASAGLAALTAIWSIGLGIWLARRGPIRP